MVIWFRRGSNPWGDPRGALASHLVGQVRDQRLTAYPLFEEFKYLGMDLKYARTLTPAIDYLCKAATRAMSALQQRCQQLHLHDLGIKCKLFDALVKPLLCYDCEIWAIVGNRTDLDKLERIQQGFLKGLLEV